MENNLDSLVYLYSVDTSSFYFDEETSVDKELLKIKSYKSMLREIIKPLNSFKDKCNNLIANKKNEDITKLEDELLTFYNHNKTFQKEIGEYLLYTGDKYIVNKESTLHISEQYLNKQINILNYELDMLANSVMSTRILREDALKENNKISLFDSTLTRSLGLISNEISTDIIVVRAYRYLIFEDIVQNGFMYNNEKYEYFASSAGQIRNKKSCFVKTSLLNKDKHAIRNKLMCGLSINKINRLGGINQNKFQAYLSLTNSASKRWDSFDIEKAIVVDDMELTISSLVDDIDHETYKVNRLVKDIAINFVDGVGMVLPSECNKSFQFRFNWFKGLLVPFDFVSFIDEYGGGNYNVVDIYGKQWDIKKDNITMIFTKSQFKLWRYYSDWSEYKNYFKRFECEASICKVEESVFEDKPINYQMLQSIELDNDDITHIARQTIQDIELIGNDKDTMMKLLGADNENKKKNNLQKALSIYPEMLNDDYCKLNIKNRKKSLVKDAKAGKILIPNTKRTYISPDLFAFCEWLFLGEVNPKGLLKNGEVSCKLFGVQELDLLRSPHLFREHCVRNNIVNNETEKWFISNCVYTSVHDLISKQLMFDVDGDDSLIVSDELFVRKAKEQMKGIVPLDYTLATAKKTRVSNKNIVIALEAAYSKNIGEISNLITKIWNSENPDLELIKILCMENNAIIDYAKCLWMPTRPDEIKSRIAKFNNSKLPHFFKYAKNKTDDQVNDISKSTMDKLVEIIPNKNINFRKVVGKFDYKNLMRNKRAKTDTEIAIQVIEKYEELNQKKHEKVKNQLKNQDKVNNSSELSVYKEIRKELLDVCSDTYKLVDILVRYLYFEKKTPHKDTLWRSFGKEVLENINLNILSIKLCQKCNIEIDITNSKKYCENCAKQVAQIQKNDWKKNKWKKN